jgi:alpha-glucosidase
MSGSAIRYYNRLGVSRRIEHGYSFFILPGFKTPDWAKGAVFYQIFVDRFYNGDRSNDVETGEYTYIGEKVEKVTDWEKPPAFMGVREFYGGDLQGIIDKLDYLQDLGVEALYLNPIFVSPSNHKYDIQDYDYVDPHYGKIVKDEGELLGVEDEGNENASRYRCRVTNRENLEASNEVLKELIEKLHKRGMRLILDGVFNHCGSFNKWMDKEKLYAAQKGYEKGAFVSEQSPYRSYFGFHKESWPDNIHYDGWWGHDTLPKLNYENSEKLKSEILRIAGKWVSPPFQADGWRLDVAADLGYSTEYNHSFWKDFRRQVREKNPEALILAEHYGDPSPWLQGDEWDTVMNYDAFMEPVTWFLTGMEKHSDEKRQELKGNANVFWDGMRYNMARLSVPSALTAMNELSNHDHSRFLTRTNGKVGRVQQLGSEAAELGTNKGIFRAAVVILMTWPGAPTIYYGDEAGLCGFTDPDNRRTYPWGKEDQELITLHKDMIQIHKAYTALKIGSLIKLNGEPGFIAYGRFCEGEKLIIAVNESWEERTVFIPAWKTGIMDEDLLLQLICTDEEGHSVKTETYHTENGMLELKMKPVSAIVLKNS